MNDQADPFHLTPEQHQILMEASLIRMLEPIRQAVASLATQVEHARRARAKHRRRVRLRNKTADTHVLKRR